MVRVVPGDIFSMASHWHHPARNFAKVNLMKHFFPTDLGSLVELLLVCSLCLVVKTFLGLVGCTFLLDCRNNCFILQDRKPFDRRRIPWNSAAIVLVSLVVE